MMKNSIKVVVSDLDGTLIDGQNISEKSINTLKKLKKKYLVGLSTGRDCCSVSKLIESLGIKTYIDFIVGSNGSEILDLNNNQYLKTHPISNNDIVSVVNRFKNLDDSIGFSIAENNKLCTYKNNEIVKFVSKIDGVGYEVINEERFFSSNPPKLVIYCEKGSDVEKDVILCASDFVAVHPHIKIISSGYGLYEVVDANVSKTNGIKTIIEKYGNTLDECICFGDADNDVDMLINCGIGVAMGNGSNKAKNAADYITGSIDEDGFSKFLESHLLC